MMYMKLIIFASLVGYLQAQNPTCYPLADYNTTFLT